MATMRRVFGGAAVVICVLALGGFRYMAAEEKKADPPPTTSEVYAKKVDQVTAAETLIEYGRSHKSPLALLAAAEMLYELEWVEGFKDEPTIEGQSKDAPKKFKPEADKVKALIEEAKKMDPKGAAIEDRVKEILTKIDDKPRGTPQGGTWVTVRLDKNGTASVSRQFIAKQIGKVTITRDTYNSHVPLSYALYDSKGTAVPHVVGASNQFSFIPTVDGAYKLVITNKHPYDTDAVVTTN